MRIFGFGQNTKASAFRRTTATVLSDARSEAVDMTESQASTDRDREEPVDLSATEEMPIVRESAYPALASVTSPDVLESKTGATDAGDDADSDVYVRRRSSPEIVLDAEALAVAAAAEAVTLFVYGWDNVQPGPLSWAFPSLRAALDAVKTMRNAIEWSIVAGSEWSSVDDARESGAVLIEQNA